MSRLGSDVVALAAILGSGAVAGVVTLAALDRGHAAPVVGDCVAASVVSVPRVVVASGHGEHSIVISPRAHVRATGACVDAVVVDEMVELELDRALAELDESRIELERVYEQGFQQRLSEEMARLEKELARLGDEAGR